jgi:hypothetical protein
MRSLVSRLRAELARGCGGGVGRGERARRGGAGVGGWGQRRRAPRGCCRQTRASRLRRRRRRRWGRPGTTRRPAPAAHAARQRCAAPDHAVRAAPDGLDGRILGGALEEAAAHLHGGDAWARMRVGGVERRVRAARPRAHGPMRARASSVRGASAPSPPAAIGAARRGPHHELVVLDVVHVVAAVRPRRRRRRGARRWRDARRCSRRGGRCVAPRAARRAWRAACTQRGLYRRAHEGCLGMLWHRFREVCEGGGQIWAGWLSRARGRGRVDRARKYWVAEERPLYGCRGPRHAGPRLEMASTAGARRVK